MSLKAILKARLRPIFVENKIFFLKLLLPLKKLKVEDCVIISSETRSGSTWLMELIYAVPGLIINWEPLHEEKGVVPADLKWGERPYIPERSNDEDTKRILRDILKFKRMSKNSMRYVTLKDSINGKKVLIKMVRSNLLLPFIVKNFKLKHKPILLHRHPIAVAISQLKNIPESQKEFSEFRIPDTLNNVRYEENYKYLNSLETQVEKQVALWCIHNMEIINHPLNGKKWVVVHYEDILLNPVAELKRISDEINLEIPIDESLFDKRSRSDFFHDYQDDKKKQLSKWRSGLSEKDLQNIQLIFEHYDLKIYSADQIMPIK